jgi:hypothetical protein
MELFLQVYAAIYLCIAYAVLVFTFTLWSEGHISFKNVFVYAAGWPIYIAWAYLNRRVY